MQQSPKPNQVAPIPAQSATPTQLTVQFCSCVHQTHNVKHHLFTVAIEDADDAAVREINEIAASSSVSDQAHSENNNSFDHSSAPHFHEVDERIVKVERSAGCVPPA
jgi:hypothetical protein